MEANTSIRPEEISVKEIILKIRGNIKYVISRWKLILLFTLLGGVLGIAYALIKKPKYTAVFTFVLEDGSKGGALSQYAGLASIAGIDIGGGGGGGVFQGDNIIELYKSRSMIEKTLLCNVNINGVNQLLIERYIKFNNLDDKWKKSNIGAVAFNDNAGKFSRTQDSIITDIVEVFNKQFLSVSKPDKKLSIINVSFTNKDELFAQLFTKKLVENVNSFYVETKTKKSFQSVKILQHQADSVRGILNGSINGVASANDATPNANPLLSSLRVPSQKKQVDIQTNSAIYAEIVKNLELSKISLQQETPLIQVIDDPVLPLSTDKPGKLKTLLIGAAIGCFLSIALIITRKIFRVILN